MRLRFSGLLSLIAVSALASAVCQTTPILHGPVTAAGTPSAFRVNDLRVECTATTKNAIITKENRTWVAHCPTRFLGEFVTIYGKRDEKSGIVTATEIESVAPVEAKVAGFAVVDSILAPMSAAGITVSADGYSIEIPASVHPAFVAPLTSQTPITTNLWIRYSGTQHTNGAVTADTVSFSPNVLKDREHRANEKREFDPGSVKDEDRQSRWSKAFRGVDPRRFPASHDTAMQERVESIGTKLIPAYQNDLPSNDPSRISFRFQVVDQPKLRDALTLSNGIILVPQQVIARLENDSQLATVLADNIACALEKQELREIPARRAMTASDIAITAGGLFVPGLGFATMATDATANAKMLKRSEEQSGRVSLVLLHAAGYDLGAAPRTWWILGTSGKKPLDATTMPYRAYYLYQLLATTWRNPAAPPADAAQAGEATPQVR